MSTIRGWWEEDRGKTQRFFNQILGNYGAAPFFCEPWIAKEILIQHLYSPALLTIFPYQDIIATDGKIRWEKTQEERINIPSNPHHLWRYRMAQQLEDLLEADDFNATLREMIKTAGR
jgi:4-alpha-glucanotransferase